MYIVASVDTFAIVSNVLFVSAFATNNTVDIVDTNIFQIALWTQ